MLNEDGELWLVYEGLKQANRLPNASPWGYVICILHPTNNGKSLNHAQNRCSKY